MYIALSQALALGQVLAVSACLQALEGVYQKHMREPSALTVISTEVTKEGAARFAPANALIRAVEVCSVAKLRLLQEEGFEPLDYTKRQIAYKWEFRPWNADLGQETTERGLCYRQTFPEIKEM